MLILIAPILIVYIAFLLFIINLDRRNVINNRLNVYKHMLMDYEANIPILVKDESGDCSKYDFNGFSNYSMCLYLNNVIGIKLITLIELLETKPSTAPQYVTSYWFPVSDREGRIECIKEAITTTETKLKRRLLLNIH